MSVQPREHVAGDLFSIDLVEKLMTRVGIKPMCYPVERDRLVSVQKLLKRLGAGADRIPGAGDDVNRQPFRDARLPRRACHVGNRGQHVNRQLHR